MESSSICPVSDIPQKLTIFINVFHAQCRVNTEHSYVTNDVFHEYQAYFMLHHQNHAELAQWEAENP